MTRLNHELPEFADRLKLEDEDARVAAYQELEILGLPQGNRMLLDGLSDPSPRVRSVVANLLVEMADASVVGMLLELLRKEDPGVRSQAITILASLGTLSWLQVAAYLEDADADVRIFAAQILGNTGLQEAFPALKRALRDPEENVRYAAVEALGQVGEPAAIPLLLDMLPDEWARYPAVASLGQLKAMEAVPHLLKLYAEDEWVHHAVIEALGNIGDADQIDFLIEALHTENDMILQASLLALARIEQLSSCGAFERVKVRGIDVEAALVAALQVHDLGIRKSAIWTLGVIGNEANLSLLLKQLGDFEEEVQDAARQALTRLGAKHLGALRDLYGCQEKFLQQELLAIFGAIGDNGAIPLVLAALEDEADVIRRAAAKALVNFKGRALMDPLIAHLTDPSSRVRSACALALGQFKAVKGIRPLMPLLEDPDADVREAVSEALGRIGGAEVIQHAVPLLKHHRGEVRQAAIQCLGLVMDKKVNSYLIDALNNAEHGVRRFAASVLGKRMVLPAIKPLMTALLDEDWQVRKSAASALGNLHDPRGVESLLHSLQDENMWVRYAAALALGRIGDARAKAPLYQCLKEEEGPVQIAAIGALREMQDQDLIATLAPLQQSPDNEIRQVVAETIAYFESLNG